MDAILYHGKCPDGFCAAFIAKKRYPEAELLPMDHGTPVPFEAVRGKDCLVLDFSWPVREDNIKLYDIAKNFHIYDHHKTAEERLAGLPFVTFDMHRSGAGLTWDHLFGIDSYKHRPLRFHTLGLNSAYKDRPFYVSYVEDRDLWNWKLPKSKEVNAYLMSLPMTIEAWQHLDKMTAEEAAVYGQPVVSHIDRYVREACQEAQYGIWHLEGKVYSTAICNCPYMNCSEIGNVLAQGADVSLTWFERKDGMTQFSLRSIDEIDVSEIAKQYLGGGHTHAAGFRLSVQEGRKLIDSILGRENG
jgi:oligoribonuclease NrnB/cAMP/cGMP phosphodiesterase (DHH superfamily)